MIITRYHNLERLELQLQFATPAFLGDAKQQAALRAAPFRGMLRYWWRILYGHQYDDVTKLATQERKIFGDTETGSRVRIAVTGEVSSKIGGFPKGEKFTVKNYPVNILEYLSYGLFKYERGKGNVYQKAHLLPGQPFDFVLDTPSAITAEVRAALWGLITYGGVGAKCRNGFGSLAIAGIKKGEMPKPTATLSEAKKHTSQQYSALNQGSKMFQTQQHFDSWEGALSKIGIAYRDARLGLERKHYFDRRGLVARPIEARNENIPKDIRGGRHPKFTFMSVRQDKGKYRGQILTLPILFYEDEKRADYRQMVDAVHNSFSRNGALEGGKL
ncbi:MAG: type III-B CRISPR module RAMP protein Cmr1 [Proteobacteria bacterium]|nr:type III-B CRISPR module RAMP protein Cmr1 [Pseudomonadota bacterium]